MSIHRTRSFAVLAVLLLFVAGATGQTDTVWVRRLSGTGNGDDRVVALAPGPSGDVYAVVQNLPDGTSSTIITARYASDGTLLWSRRFGVGRHIVPVDIAVDADGNALVVGTSEIPLPDSIVTIKYSSSGDSCWVRYYNTEGNNDMAAGVLVDGAGNVYVAGTSETDNDYENMLLVKYSSSGEEQWARLYDYQHEEDFGLALVMDRQGYIYEAGAVMNWHGGGHFDLSVLKYSPDGVLQWARAFSGPGMNEDSAVALAVDPQNNLVVAGYSHPNFDSSGFLVVKYSPSGDTLWSRCVIGDRDDNGAVGIGTDSLGNVVFAGNLDRAYLIVKYSPSGSELWQQTYNGPGYHDSLVAFVVEPGGDVCVTGWSEQRGGNDDAVTAMYSSAGDSLWAQRCDRLISGGLALAQAGDRYCVGGTYGREYHYDASLVSYDRAGNECWFRGLGGPGPSADLATDVVFDPAGNVVVAGYLDVTGEGRDLAVAKYSPAGELLWLRTYGNVRARNDVATAVAADRWNNVYVTGHSEGESTGRDYVTLKYDPDGNQLWVMRYDGPAHRNDTTTGLAVDRSGNVVVTGQSHGVGTDLDYATVRYTSSGHELWVRRHNGSADSADWALDVVVDSAGAAYVTGKTHESGRRYPATTIKYDFAGSVLWALECEDPDPGWTDFWASSVVLGPTGDVYLAGSGRRALLAARLSPEGETLWVRRVGLSEHCAVHAAVVDDEGRLCATGYLADGDWDDYLTTAFRPSGELLWQRTYEGNSLRSDVAYDIAAGSAGRVYVTGHAQNDWPFDATTICYDSLGNVVWTDSYGIGNTLYEKGMALAVGPNGRVAVVGSGGGFSDYDLLTVIYEPRIGIAEAPERAKPARPAATLTRGRLRVAEPGRLYDTSGRQVCLLWRGGNDVRYLAPGVYTVHTVSGALSRVVKVR